MPYDSRGVWQPDLPPSQPYRPAPATPRKKPESFNPDDPHAFTNAPKDTGSASSQQVPAFGQRGLEFAGGVAKGLGREAVGIGGLATDLTDLASQWSGWSGPGRVADFLAEQGQPVKRYLMKPTEGAAEGTGVVAGEVAPWLMAGPEKLLQRGVRRLAQRGSEKAEMMSPSMTKRLLELEKKAAGPHASSEAARAVGYNPLTAAEATERSILRGKTYRPPASSGLGDIARSSAAGAGIGAAQPANTPGERLGNAEWGASLGGALRLLGVAGSAISPAVAGAAKKSIAQVISLGIAEQAMHKFFPGSGFGFWSVKKALDASGIADAFAERLPEILRRAGGMVGNVSPSAVLPPNLRGSLLPEEPGYDEAPDRGRSNVYNPDDASAFRNR